MPIRERAKLVIDLDGADEATVTVTGASVYPTRASSSAVSFPATITVNTTYYVVTDPPSTITVSIKVNGLELGQYASRSFTIDNDRMFVLKPMFHRANKEMFEDSSITLGSPAVGATTAVHAAVTDTGVEVDVTTAITNPDVPRNITATAGGTAGDIKAIQVTIDGTDIDGNVITEDLPAFTVNTTGTVVGSKAFATVTSITIPAHDGTGATTAIGTGAKLGLPKTLARNNVFAAYVDDVKEGTAPTVATSASVLASNTITLNTALDGSEITVILV